MKNGHVYPAIGLGFVLFTLSCQNTSFSGKPSKGEEEKTSSTSQAPVPKSQNGATQTEPPANHPEPQKGVPPPEEGFTPPPDVPNPPNDGSIDGQEIINDCDRCLVRARTLSSQIGFAADKNKTFNLGFYKIEPSRNLCDIHFMADMSVPIDDHEGKDSLGNRQIMVYCPCNCGWKENYLSL